MNGKNEEMNLVDIKDNLSNLKDYIEILYLTHLAIENGDYDERPSIGNVILFDYLVKSKELLGTINDFMKSEMVQQ